MLVCVPSLAIKVEGPHLLKKNWILSCLCHFMSPLDAPILHRNMAPKHMAGVSIIQD